MVEETRQLSPKELLVYEDLNNAATIEDINKSMSEKEVDFKLVDDYLFRQKTSKILAGLTIQKASSGWPRNRKEVLQLLKIQIEKKADFPRTLAVESKSQAPRNHLKILLEIIFSESIVALEPEPDAGNNNNLDLEEIAAKATENTPISLGYRWFVSLLLLQKESEFGASCPKWSIQDSQNQKKRTAAPQNRS